LIRQGESVSFEAERRAARLKQYWLEELAQREKPVESAPIEVIESPAKHAKNGSVHGVVVGVREMEPLSE
jgi:hypothetical protein